MTKLEARSLSKRFGNIDVLSRINLVFEGGECHAILGENGAGKSTLVKVLSGVLQPSSGDVVLNQHPIRFRSPLDASHAGIAIIHQETSLIPTMNAVENVFLGHELTQSGGIIDIKQQLADYATLCHRLGCDIAPHRLVGDLSVAEQKQLEILKALNKQSRVIILDEPTDSLSETEKLHLFELINQLKLQGLTLIYITHHLNEVFAVCDRLSVLRDGKLVGESSVSGITTDEIITMMVGANKTFLERKRSDLSRAKSLIDIVNLHDDIRINGVSFEVKEGEIVAIVGPVGAGKTEIAKMISGATPPTKGHAIWKEQAVLKLQSIREQVEHGIMLVSEDRRRDGIIQEHEVYKVMSIPALTEMSHFGIIDEERERKICQYYAWLLNIRTHNLAQPIDELSGGNQQKVIIAKTLVKQAKLLVLDEPTRGIDIGARGDIYRIIDELTENGLGVILFTSDITEALKLADRIHTLQHGTLTHTFDHYASAETISAALQAPTTQRRQHHGIE
ncbi:sugar ABC transporter ATP-binding protein [Thaumasiovibrio subtropicus]|uniref:sugar ABC transporter ATP-binding protein n=1 Tax=Thaumasiovibrio subtropicus TaxID=1891207 RepID=UPI000B36486C|nr:sugar ABC transporter ATP-binding protein [Thaumasiovibrio subtropicus]